MHCAHTTNCLLLVLLYIQHPHHHCYNSKAVARRNSTKKMFLEILQTLQEDICVKVSFFNKTAGLRPATLLKIRLWHRRFPVNFARFLKTPFITEHPWWLLLITVNISDVCFWFKFKGFKWFKSGISFSLKSLSSVLFSFPMLFLCFSVLFSFFLAAVHKKNSFKLRIH